MSDSSLQPYVGSQFSILGDLQINKHGVVGFVLLDSRPKQRCVSYSIGEWTGVPVRPEDVAYDSRGMDRIRRGHWIGTETGFALIRWFIHPDEVAQFYARDKFLGDPVIAKCQSDTDVIPKEFDEEREVACWSPCSDAMPLVDTIVALLSNQIPGLLANWREGVRPRDWCYLSFHPWQYLEEAAATALASIPIALANLEVLPDRASPQQQKPAIWDENCLPPAIRDA